MEQERFLAQLDALTAQAEAQEQWLTKEEIADAMPGLTDEQFQAVITYLTEHQIRVRGIAEDVPEREEEEIREAFESLAEESPYFAAYYEEIKKVPVLTEEEEDELFRRACEGDEGARAKLVESQLPLAAETALLYRDQGTRFEDLIQEGSLGVLLGIEEAIARGRSDWRKSVSRAIMEAMENAVYEDNAQVSVGRKSVESAQSVREAAKQFETEFGYEASKEQLADYLDMNPDEFEDILKLGADEKDFLSGGEEDEETEG